MRATIVMDDELIELITTASEYIGVTKVSELVHEGLKALIAREAGRRLSALSGSAPELKLPPRRRPKRSS